MKILFSLLLCVLFMFNGVKGVYAQNNPLDSPNNIFGIHITNENDLKDANDLLNSSGGDWGYVTFVITESERDHARWQKTFDEMRKLHLIPIVRIATKPEGENWTIPSDAEINNWVSFLNSLNWVIQNRYVVIGNEPNHAKEWGGAIDPAGYASYLNNFAGKLHKASSDFYVLPAGLDASSKNSKETMDEAMFIKRMLAKEPDLFNNIDGWASHSYPNPDFAGKETDIGRGSLKTYEWELSYLKSLGVSKYLPVFITETGWSNEMIDSDKISEMYKYAFKSVWSNKEIVAVTPFILNYTDSPFTQFTWKKKDGSFFPYYQAYKDIPKAKGSPVQIDSGQIIGALAQPIMFKNSDFIGAMLVKNTGQSIWTTYNTQLVSDIQGISFKNVLFFDIEPLKNGLIVFKASTTQEKGIYIKSIFLSNINGKRITNSFPIEGVIMSTDKKQAQSFSEKVLIFVKSLSIQTLTQ